MLQQILRIALLCIISKGLLAKPLPVPKLAETCATCHNLDGNSSNGTWPNLAGQDQKYLLKQLFDFKKGPSGPRDNALMYGMANPLSEAQMLEISAYFASCEPKLGEVNPELKDLGEKIFRGGNRGSGLPACAACHQMDGEGNALAGFPRLSGQHAEYTSNQLKLFRDAKRKNDYNGIMRDIASKMSDKEIEAVSSYVSGLHG